MPNECWLRWKAPLMKSEGVPHTAIEPSTEQGPTRRDPRGTLRARGDSTCPVPEGNEPYEQGPQCASAMGGFAATSRRSCGPDGKVERPVERASSVAPFGVSANPRLAHANRALAARDGHTYEVQETDGVDPSEQRVPLATVGDGCPGVVTL
jgi:hypothetical protein